MTFVNKLYVDFIDHRRNTKSFDLVYFYYLLYYVPVIDGMSFSILSLQKKYIMPIQQSSLLAFGKGFWQNMVSGEGEDNTIKLRLISK